MGQPKASKPEVPGSTLDSSCFSIEFITKLITINRNTRTKVLLFVL